MSLPAELISKEIAKAQAIRRENSNPNELQRRLALATPGSVQMLTLNKSP